MRNNIAINLFCAAILANLISFPSAAAIQKGTLNITIDGLKNQKGQICMSLFASNRGFPSDSRKAVKGKCIKVNGSSIVVNFSNLNPGSYAAAVIHDANSDKNLNRNYLGIPTEGFGFSRNPQIVSGPPKFGDTSFLVVGNSTNIAIQLQYLF
ncbi:DUF2141 domain-containing protein [Merismopedia glauca]|uniref:DUF2141 domain-containing protein n=1 Tax=Merismopedia glauca CCAP 1448/3 TaxID=1296344 RepID=A0A2T1BZM7_9CYAN|nr:DUF2141 domain-containing protein [Merismopedia glauca]PSB01479.1 hypothetical protein C7B64_18110 [Merismopedia glauca CCAP 1448/3]